MTLKDKKKYLLVIEDDPGLQRQLKWCFEGYEVLIAGTRESAIAQLRRYEPSVVTLDLGLPPDPANATEGLKVLQEILTLAPYTKVIVVTGNDDRENAIQAVSIGAYDYYQKPIDSKMLSMIVDRAYTLYQLEDENRKLVRKNRLTPIEGIIASSPQMMKVCRTIEKVAPVDVTTLLLGESGTGKELVARALHSMSGRESKPFVALNCAAIPDNLLESELFGYEKGAFTGAAKQTRGKIEFAEGGTFLLDEIGDLSLALQAKILRFLQERVIERVGGRQEIPVDVRVICATHRDLEQMIKEERFREDLYYRISEITIQIPPLRERSGDALLLAKSFLEKFCSLQGRSAKVFSSDAQAAIVQHLWPGNVRELENKVKRAVIMSDSDQVTAEDMELDSIVSSDNIVNVLNLRYAREQAEITAVQQALSLTKNNVSKAAELLGVSRPTLYDLMNKFGFN
ncbi:MAG: PEP-CTERM-box response regulator transcription factor [Gammaproteobacteria bacterium]|nr:PEP-CTERM-box response regulator transcription factor [Gammaproteobacteria bacterium]MDH5799206.1 PEP-CTERM-box response regulator transcription factor [Gammaproteobacteria bacterium]